MHAHAGIGAQQRHRRADRRAELGDDGRVGHALHAHAERDDEQQVKSGVQRRRHQQEVERPSGIAHRAQNARAHVVKQQSGHAREIVRQIRLRFGKHLGRRVLHAQRHGRNDNAQHRERHGHRRRQHDGRVHRLVHLALVTRAEILRNHHARTAGQPAERADEQIDDGPDGTDGGKRLAADVVAHHPGIHHVVKLLKQIAQQQRNREIQQMMKRLAHRHVHFIVLRPILPFPQLHTKSTPLYKYFLIL